MSGVLIISDLHAHAWSRFATTLPNGMNSRFGHLLAVLDQIEDIAKACDVEMLAILGDLTHQRYFMRFSIYTPLMAWLAKMQREIGRVVVLKGNHDEETETTHALGPLALCGIEVIDTPKYLEVASRTTLWVPYMNGERIVSAVQEHKADQVFLHYALDGKVMTGGEYALTTPLRLSDLDGFDRIVLGHVHAPSVEQDARVIYVGAPLHFDFGDTGDRFAWHFPDGGGAPRAYKLDFPKFVTTTYPRIGTAPLTDGFLRVLNTPANLFEDVKREAHEQGWLDCVAIEERMPDEAVRVLSSAIMADEAVVRSWVERQYANLSVVEREPIIAFGLDCLRAAQR
jgi:DNA repair exonuclease SbcCD nuclease subunit